MQRKERIPLHDHSDFYSGGIVAAHTVVQAAAGASGGGGSHADTDHGSFLLRDQGGNDEVNALGALGSAADWDPALGNVAYAELDDDCTLTILAPAHAGGATLELWATQDGTGGWLLTIAADGGTVTGDISAHTTTADETFRVIAERIPGTTNDWVVDLVGGSGGASFDDGADPEPVALVAAPGDDIYAARRDHVHDIDPEAVELAGHWEPLMDGGSPYAPLDDGTGTDWLFVWVPG